MKYTLWLLMGIVILPAAAIAQVVHQEFQETISAEVLEILDVDEREIVGTDAVVTIQTVRAYVTSGTRKGEEVVFENELTELAAGDKVFLNRLELINGTEQIVFQDVDRRWSLATLFVVFVSVLLIFAGMKGFKALLSLGLSIGAILFLLVPALLAGYAPVLASVSVAGIVLALVLLLTHGINPLSFIALSGTFLAVVVTGGFATLWVATAGLTGFGSDAAIYLNIGTKGALDFSGLLLGGIIIGMLGVLDDVSITQASVVAELKSANVSLSAKELYHRAIRVGRNHVASLVNTLAFAYIGVSLPLVLLLSRIDTPIDMTVNQEIVAAELVRILVGSIGLILAVPITTAIAAWWFSKYDVDTSEYIHHGHSHL